MQTKADVFNVPAAVHSDRVNHNAAIDNWQFSDRQKERWELAAEEWQDFNRRWRDPSNVEINALTGSAPSFSHEQLGQIVPLPPRYIPRVLVRTTYKETFNKIWVNALTLSERTSAGQGYIVTGQPGIGKTCFLWYMLIRLLEQKQVVIFSPDGKMLHLFFSDNVYQATVTSISAASLPLPRKHVPSFYQVFIWSLFNIPELRGPESPLIGSECFAVQSASPNRRCYGQWQKQLAAELCYMPLWIPVELEIGLYLQPLYLKLKDALRSYFSGDRASLSGFPGVSEVLRGATRPEPMTPDKSIEFLLEQAIDRYGHAAQDVYRAIFNPKSVDRLYGCRSMTATCHELDSLATTVIGNSYSSARAEDFYRVLAVDADDQGRSIRTFRSRRIRRLCVQEMAKMQNDRVREMYKDLHTNPGLGSLSEALFEVIIHAQLSSAAPGSSDGTWRQYEMVSDGQEPPKFRVDASSAVAVTDTRFQRRKRTTQHFTPDSLPEQFREDVYYVPDVGNSPVLDAVAFELGDRDLPSTLWLIQISASPLHQDSSERYPAIHDLKKRLTAQLERQKQSSPVVVRYLLVVPQDTATKFEWQFPSGWDDSAGRKDHQGKVFCLCITV